MIITVLTLLTPNTTTVALSRTIVKGEGIKLKKKTTFVIKSNILVSNYTIHYQKMNSVSMYGILTRKYALNTHFV